MIEYDTQSVKSLFEMIKAGVETGKSLVEMIDCYLLFKMTRPVNFPNQTSSRIINSFKLLPNDFTKVCKFS